MDLANLVKIALQASIALTVVSLGMQVRFADIVKFLAAPRQLFRALVAVLVVMPACAVLFVSLTDLPPAVKLALVALSLSPVPPILPRKQLKAGGDSGYVFGLLVAAALAAIVFVPVALEVIGRIFGMSLQISPLGVAKVVLLTVLGPLAVGMLIGAVLPALAARSAGPLGHFATGLLGLGIVLILVKTGPAMLSLVGNGTVIAFMAFTAVGLAVGHLLGGPTPGDRGALAIATATRHPGVALTIASVNFPDQTLALPAVLMYMLIAIVLSMPYMRWLKKKSSGMDAPTTGAAG